MPFRGVEKKVVDQAADGKGDHDASRQRAFGLGPQAGPPKGDGEQRDEQAQSSNTQLRRHEQVLVVRMLLGTVMEERMVIDAGLVEGLAPAPGANTDPGVSFHPFGGPFPIVKPLCNGVFGWIAPIASRLGAGLVDALLEGRRPQVGRRGRDAQYEARDHDALRQPAPACQP